MLPGITVSGVRSETVTSAPSARAPRTSPERFPRPAAGPPVAGRGAKYAPRLDAIAVMLAAPPGLWIGDRSFLGARTAH